ncbi:trehalose-phosphatase [Shewanella sp. Isolate11]|uniref:trehalose-phosphatase n=1 Tax=Shewanella sp. Isolate11 TaxID=2908530 RepID=UPI001EFC7DE5|nr:trehalose-phosphatase [Shewanella sp. Isolate11]MCG9697461.1 trehalose-phosphatase [Shewanella sp. Isolate11]
MALFLDFDGTLVEFAQTPEGVTVPNRLTDILQRLDLHLNGAIALISGRTLKSLANLVDMPLNMAGSHGAEWQHPNGIPYSQSIAHPSFLAIKNQLLNYANCHNLIAEDKGDAIAIHYRQAPAQQQQLDDYIADTLKSEDPKEIRVIRGNCVREIQIAGSDKGVAIARFMSKPPFYGRRAIFIGDDTTDEDGFAWVNDNGGISIKVGDGPSCAQQRLSNTGEVLAFLTMKVAQLEKQEERTDESTQPGTCTHR